MTQTITALSGATRVHFIVGDPIAQVMAPAGVTQSFHAQGVNAVVVPAHVATQDLGAWMHGVTQAKNVDGIIVTVPHKFDCFALCATHSERARFLGAVNTLRRNGDGTWHGDMFDGLGYVKALVQQGCQLDKRRCLLVGAGGAGTAIAHALVMSGVSHLAIHDVDAVRRTALVERLRSLARCTIEHGSDDPSSFDVAINATPLGMCANDALPLQAHKLVASTFVGCVITSPAVSPLIAAARAIGCRTATGADMFAQVRELMVAFLLHR